MNYEEFYSELQEKEKNLKDSLARYQNAIKNLIKNSAKGDLKSLNKDMSALETILTDQMAYLREYQQLAGNFDVKEYMQNGDFAEQMLTYCESMGVDVRGDYPAYEMFPYKVKIDGEAQEIAIDRKRMNCARPQHLVSDIKQSREKLMKASFNAQVFLNDIAEAYDKISVIKRKEDNSKRRNLELSLRDLYRFLAPMQRFRREYDIQSFSFDLARLYASDAEFTADGRQYRMGPARNQSQNIRILDKNGAEAWVGTITFYSSESES